MPDVDTVGTQISELVDFLNDPRPDVRNIAAENVASLSTQSNLYPYFKRDDYKTIRNLMNLVPGEPLAANEALKALINMCIDVDFVNVMAEDKKFIDSLILTIILPKSIVADMCCMLLSNLTENIAVARILIEHKPPKAFAPLDDSNKEKEIKEEERTGYLDNLLEIFVRGSDGNYNPKANFSFLSGVFTHIAMTSIGAEWFRGRTKIDGNLRLSKIVPFIGHPDKIRRNGTVAIVKNVSFEISAHMLLLQDEELNLLPYLLLPLCGNEEYDIDDMEGMPDELQFLEDDKKRETDYKIRLTLVEILLLLATTRSGREYQRSKKVYPIIQKLHLWEESESVKDAIDNLVQLLCRDEETISQTLDITKMIKDSDNNTDENNDIKKRKKNVNIKDYQIGDITDSEDENDEKLNSITTLV